MNKYKVIGSFLHLVYKILNLLTKKEYYNSEKIIKEQNIYVFWHRKIFTVCNMTRAVKTKASMVSASRDGEILSELLRREGNELIRGSSNNDNIKSLKEAMKYARKGYSLGIATDGPAGPIYEPKPGAVFIAKKTGVQIVPLGTYCDNAYVFEKMWDRLEIPKPFSKCVHYFGEPLRLSGDITVEQGIELVKNKITEAEQKAKEIYIKKYLKK